MTILRVFCSVIRSVIEYASPAYHPLLTVQLEEKLEKMQKMSLKTIFGHDKSYAEILEKAGIESLKSRRSAYFEKFTLKSEANEKINKKWFQPAMKKPYSLSSLKQLMQLTL